MDHKDDYISGPDYHWIECHHKNKNDSLFGVRSSVYLRKHYTIKEQVVYGGELFNNLRSWLFSEKHSVVLLEGIIPGT